MTGIISGEGGHVLSINGTMSMLIANRWYLRRKDRQYRE
jgi:hypothetical protein